MIRRRSLEVVTDRLRHASAVALLGPRQVGKTTLARAIGRDRGTQAVYLDLEDPADRRRLDDPGAFLRAQGAKLVILDEIHRAPGLFEVLRGVIDHRREAGQPVGHFLLLGSASLDLMRQATESLAGRIAYVELGPVGATELPMGRTDVDALWLRGGFPLSLLATNDRESLVWRRDFVRSYPERDVPMFAPRLPAETVGRCWRMLAHGQGTLLNQARLAASLGVSAPAVGRYVDLLADLLLVRRLPSWSGNLGKRLVRTPKTYVRDAGLLHALLELETIYDLLGHPVAGASWEGFIIENLIAAAGGARVPYFLRTEGGAEIDLVLERGGRVEMAIEVKRTTAPTVSKGFHVGVAHLAPKERYVVHGGTESWPMPGGVTAISLRTLMTRLEETQ